MRAYHIFIFSKIIRFSFLLFLFLGVCAVSILAAPVKIMPLGDSITGTPGCWRAYLWNKLRDSGFTNIDFVGTQMGQTCSLPFDADCEGHGSIRATDIADRNQLPPWLAAASPDIVMMHLGTNDLMTSNITTEMVLAAYSKMIDQMRSNNPDMKVLVAQIIPMYSPTSGCTTCYQLVVDLNAAIPAWAAGKTTSRSPVVVVDLWTGFNTGTDTYDGIHPVDEGNRKISDSWYPDLIRFLAPDRTPSPTELPTASPGTTMPGDVNSSGTIDIIDALIIAQYYVGLNPVNFNSAAADVNCSGGIDILDALFAAQYYVGLISGFPC